MVEIKQCDFCRAPYHFMGNKLCGECIVKLDDAFMKIRDYLYDHGRGGIEEVSDATGVSRKTIFYLLKEERLLVGNEDGEANAILTCETCKRPIHTGRMCAGCKNQVLSDIQQSVGPVMKPKRRPIEEEDGEEEKSIKGIAKLQLKGRK